MEPKSGSSMESDTEKMVPLLNMPMEISFGSSMESLSPKKDGPAIEDANGTKEWFLNGKRHREDGPAVEYANGDKLWFLNGKPFSKEGWFEQLTEEQQEKLLFNSEIMA